MTGTNRTATFMADGKVVWRAYFDSKGLGTPIPPVPRKSGFVGEWAPTEFSDRDLTVVATYRPVRMTFVQHDGTAVERSPGDEIPEPLPVPGCVGEWEPFHVSDCDIEVHPRYKGPRHSVRLYIDGRFHGEVECRRGEFPRLPPVPLRNGYIGRWEPYVPRAGAVSVSAVYRPLKHVFEVGIGKTVEVPYGGEFPEIPERPGCKPYWKRARTATGDYRMSMSYDVPPVLEGFEESGTLLDREKVRQAVEDLGFISEHWSTVEEETRIDDEPVNSINYIEDIQEGSEWERLVRQLSDLQKEYLAACIGMCGSPQGVLKRSGTTALVMESGINAIAEDLIGDPLMEGGEVDPDYSDELEEVLKDGN